MHEERALLPPRLMRPDLVERRDEGLDLLGRGRRLLHLTLVQVLVPERPLEALDDAIGLGPMVTRARLPATAADILRTRRLTTADYGPTRTSTMPSWKPGLCCTFAHESASPSTAS